MSKIPVVIIDNDLNARETLKEAIKGKPALGIMAEFDSMDAGFNAVLKEKPPVVFIDITHDTQEVLEHINRINVQNPGTNVFVMSESDSSDTVMQAMRAGAREFLLKPLNEDELKFVVNKAVSLTKAITSGEERNEGKIITVFSNKGGIGKTSIASNLAVNLADMTKEKVVLIDLNLQLGDITTFLNLNPAYDVSYLTNNLSRIDEGFLFGSLEKYKNKNLYVLADPPYLEQAEEVSAEKIEALLTILKMYFSYIIIDASNVFDAKTLSALDNSDDILLVSIVNLPAIRNAQRCLDLFERLDYPSSKIKLIINRYMKDDEITSKDVENTLNHPIFWKIPNNYFTIISSINKGIPVCDVEPDSPLAKNYKQLAGLICNKEVKQGQTQKQSFLKSLLSKIF